MMDRKAEYERLVEEISASSERAEGTVERARKRLMRRRMFTRPAVTIAAVFVCFVALVNLSHTVAEACYSVPCLRELARAVTFSRSLSDAVDNEYIQPLELTQTDGNITASVEYLIVDQKQVTVFFRLESEVYGHMTAEPNFRDADGEFLGSCAYGLNDHEVPNGQLQSVTLDFVDGDVPDTLRMYLKVRDVGGWQASAVMPPEDQIITDDNDRWDIAQKDAEYVEPEYDARFDFRLEFDPYFTQQGRRMEVNRTVELGDQKIIITDIEIFPSHLRLNVDAPEDNSSWLKGLEFRILAGGEIFDTVKNGISATGSTDTPMMSSYRADSTFFYEVEELTIEITAAQWLDKDMERVRIDLAGGSADVMPEGAELIKTERRGDRWVVTVGCAMRNWDGDENKANFHQIFLGTCYDPEGNEYHINTWSSNILTDEYGERSGYFYEEFPLYGYPYDEVWLTPAYSRYWQAVEPVTITVAD